MSPSRSRRRRRRKRKSNSKKIILIVALFAVVVTIIVGYNMLGSNGSNGDVPNNNVPSNNATSKNKVLFETNMGNITIQLRDDMPITTGNFVNLTQHNMYDSTLFHRVVNLPDNLVIIQGGDPTGTGYGDSAIPNIQDEFSENPENNKNKRGAIAMANTGAPNSGSSQFFINVVYNSHLDNLHPVFGEVIEGMDVVDAISNVVTDDDGRPVQPVILNRATLID